MLDILIRNARVIDGAGAPALTADVGVQNGRIAAVGKLAGARSAQTIDARGRCLTPGFIDIHRHHDAAVFRGEVGEGELCQGLTTLIGGNCGLSLVPLCGPNADALAAYLTPITGRFGPDCRFGSMRDYLAALDAARPPLHSGMLVGLGTLRALAAGFSPEPLSPQQKKDVQQMLSRALEDGALGVSLGLGYAPDCFYTTGELIDVLAPLRGSDVVLSVHMRQEGDGVVSSLEEMLAVARALRIPVEISHLKAIGRRNWRSAVPRMLSLLSRAREDGLDVGCDVYPYAAGSTQLIHVLPPEFQRGGVDALCDALRDGAARAAMRSRMKTGRDFENITALVGFENVRPVGLSLPENRRFEGQSLAAVADALGKDPFDALFDLLAQEHCLPGMIDFIADEADIEDILRAPFSCVISDATYPTDGLLHPRVYGAFTRLLEEYVRRRHVLTPEAAVHRITGLPAARYALARKGRIAPGMDADLCLFDPDALHERADFSSPRQCSAGMDCVLVGGQVALLHGRVTDRHAGRALTRPARA